MAMHGICAVIFTFLMAYSYSGFAQESFKSLEVHADRAVTVRFRDAGAKEVMFDLEGAKPAAMSKGADGVWTITTAPLEPDYYGYFFLVDGVPQLDSDNLLSSRT
jgi:enterochelin esterase family protein